VAAAVASALVAASAHGVSVSAVERQGARVDARLTTIERVRTRYERWHRCLHAVPVSEFGDPDAAGPGYPYDERDGTGVGPRSALSPAPAAGADYTFLAFADRAGCRTHHTEPGGTAESARVRRTRRATPSLAARVRALEARVAALERRERRVRAAAARFDAWSSCLSQLPITEVGDPAGAFGFLTGPRVLAPGTRQRYRPALVIDRSDWDDPDYRLLAFARGDRPGHDCDTDPGEASD
jgi:hypothetical protein